jgi:cobalt-zinc-cadmium efflux system outer membrane protein
VTKAQTWPNPSFDYARETSDEGDGDTTENFFSVSQQVDVSGRRKLEVEAARQRLGATAQDNAAWQQERTSTIRRQFFETLYLQRFQAAHSGWLGRMDAIEDVMRKRESAGDISGYDLRRLQRERAFVQAERKRIRAEYERMIEELHGLIGGERSWSTLSGSLLPPQLPSLAALLQRLPGRPELAAMKLQQQALATEERIGERWWIPEITLSLGAKTVDTPSGDGSGLLLGASIPIPVFDRDAAERQRSRAKSNLIRSEHRLALARSEGRVRGLWRQASDLTKDAHSFEVQSEKTSGSLIATAEAAYKAGEIGVLEILDAYRSAFEDEARALSLMREARMARIELDSITGGNTQ